MPSRGRLSPDALTLNVSPRRPGRVAFSRELPRGASGKPPRPRRLRRGTSVGTQRPRGTSWIARSEAPSLEGFAPPNAPLGRSMGAVLPGGAERAPQRPSTAPPRPERESPNAPKEPKAPSKHPDAPKTAFKRLRTTPLIFSPTAQRSLVTLCPCGLRRSWPHAWALGCRPAAVPPPFPPPGAGIEAVWRGSALVT